MQVLSSGRGGLGSFIPGFLPNPADMKMNGWMACMCVTYIHVMLLHDALGWSDKLAIPRSLAVGKPLEEIGLMFL